MNAKEVQPGSLNKEDIIVAYVLPIENQEILVDSGGVPALWVRLAQGRAL